MATATVAAVHYRCRNQHLGSGGGWTRSLLDEDATGGLLTETVIGRLHDRWRNGPKHNGRARWLFHLPAWCHALCRDVKLPTAPVDVASVDSERCHVASFVNERCMADVTLHYVDLLPHPLRPMYIVVIACIDFLFNYDNLLRYRHTVIHCHAKRHHF